jgi:hypothetical protein
MKLHDDQWTIGQLIDALAKRDPDQAVLFDCGGTRPGGIFSYRGYYEDLSIGVTEKHTNVDVEQLLATLRHAIGQTFTGYKGGGYTASRDTALWVSNYGEAYSTIITGIEDEEGYYTVLKTRYAP